MYYSQYLHADLHVLLSEITRMKQDGEAWVIFDNTAYGHAAGDALLLQDLVGEKAVSGCSNA
jgi:uncharacterized protein YecE (DUF72 family)